MVQQRRRNELCEQGQCSSCGSACPNANVKIPMRRLAERYDGNQIDCACGSGSDAGIPEGASYFVERPNQPRRPGCGELRGAPGQEQRCCSAVTCKKMPE